jgi:DNA/RNA-binding domain of Phe-tRNA-synthetase-like protein
MARTEFPPEVRHELPGWTLLWAELAVAGDDTAALAALRSSSAARARAAHALDHLAEHPTVAALRRLFRAAGCDPTRYRPSSEALLRRVLKGEEVPAIHPLVDFNNCLSLELACPACVMNVANLRPPFVLRAGRPGESYESLRGPFNLEAKPLLADAEGACDAPITGGERVKVLPETTHAWLVAYTPTTVVTPARGGEVLRALFASAPVVAMTSWGWTGEA